jgi:phenylacetate-CoA oxygenase PaaI subunit
VSSQTTKSYQEVEELEAGLATALLSWGLCLADTKQRIGLRTSEWVNGGPALEAAVGASAITQDELGHARSLYAMLRDFPGAPDSIGAENDLEARNTYYCPRLLNEPWPSWLDVITVNILLDRAMSIAIASAEASTFGPLKGRIGKILQEEEFHRIFGDSWLAKLARMNEEMRGKLQASVNHFWNAALGWFGPDEDTIALMLHDAGILGHKPAQLRQQWLDAVTPLLHKNDLTIPAEVLNWSGWDSTFREVR